MRFERDGFAVFTWETDAYGNKIAGSEQRHEIAPQKTEKWIWTVADTALNARANQTPEARGVVMELWETDSRLPATRLFAERSKQGSMEWWQQFKNGSTQ